MTMQPPQFRRVAGPNRTCAVVVLAALCLGGSVSAFGATFCAHDAAEIQTALTAAQANGEDDAVYIVSGSYPLAASLTFDSSEAHTIIINGGFDDASCALDSFNLAGAGTVLDGQHAVRPLYISNPNGSVGLQGLTLIAGSASNGSAGGGAVIAGCAGCIINYNQFFANRVSGAGALAGALLINGTTSLNFANNAIFGNRGTEVGGVVLNFGNGIGYVKNNTIVANITDTLADPGGLVLQGGMQYHVSSNIVWSNAAPGGSDFGVTATNTRVKNDIGTVKAGGTAGTVSGEVSVDPLFVDCGFLCISYELADGSPLINAGEDQPGGIPLALDLAGKARYFSTHIDIGAYEYDDTLFANGFDPP